MDKKFTTFASSTSNKLVNSPLLTLCLTSPGKKTRVTEVTLPYRHAHSPFSPPPFLLQQFPAAVCDFARAPPQLAHFSALTSPLAQPVVTARGMLLLLYRPLKITSPLSTVWPQTDGAARPMGYKRPWTPRPLTLSQRLLNWTPVTSSLLFALLGHAWKRLTGGSSSLMLPRAGRLDRREEGKGGAQSAAGGANLATRRTGNLAMRK